MKRQYRFYLPVVMLLLAGALHAQPQFDIDAYKNFLTTTKDLSGEQLRVRFPDGKFLQRSDVNLASTCYADSIELKYMLTDGEKSLIAQHGFMVSERLSRESFGQAFLEIYKNDLPVFVSTDAILHALHMSYDAILMDIEKGMLIPKLGQLLEQLHDQLPVLAQKYALHPEMTTMFNDLDVYLTVPRTLLSEFPVATKFPANDKAVRDLLKMIADESPAGYKLFAAECSRLIDFSQFTPRGHYTQSPELTRYFQAMIWLGRTEMYLKAPASDDACKPTEQDIQRQTIDAALLAEATQGANAYALLEDIDATIRSLVGESDNVTLPNLRSLFAESGIQRASDLLDMQTLKTVQANLSQKSYAIQRINSQILMSDPTSPDQIVPASAFLLLGQRFIIDSYVTGNVVYDRIMHKGAKVTRMLPSTLDVLFALGNNAAAQFLQPEMQQYPYGSSLAALRYLVDSYEPAFWSSTFYNGWLGAIRTLNPPQDKSHLPAFMRTAAWWQQKMNTQLASWAQLRHDNLLYAKQSYSGGVGCYFPHSFVEPIPEFYRAVGVLAADAQVRFQQIPFESEGMRQHVIDYFSDMQKTCDTLEAIAAAELEGRPLSSDQEHFLRTMLYSVPVGCTTELIGWYSRLFYTGEVGLMTNDLVVADIHTAPTDEVGNMVGWVKHVGTGPINLAVVTHESPDGGTIAYIGPVMSYYEHLSTNFKRLTDEEWKTAYEASPSFRPDFVYLYLADKNGNANASAPMLISSVGNAPGTGPRVSADVQTWNYPNPFSTSTTIGVKIPQQLGDKVADLTIYDTQGRTVRTLLHQRMPAAGYAITWDAKAEDGTPVTDGVYLYQITIDDQVVSGKMTVVR